MGRKGWRRREKSAIQQAFIECQVRAEHMVSSNRCCEGNKKEMEYEFLPQDKRDRDISTVSSILDPDILTLFPKHVSMKSRSQQPGASRNILAASVCVSMRKHVWGGKEREGEGKSKVKIESKKSSVSFGKTDSITCFSVPFHPSGIAFSQIKGEPVYSLGSTRSPLLEIFDRWFKKFFSLDSKGCFNAFSFAEKLRMSRINKEQFSKPHILIYKKDAWIKL